MLWLETTETINGVLWHAHPSPLRCPSCGSTCAHYTRADGMMRRCLNPFCYAERPTTLADYEDVLS